MIDFHTHILPNIDDGSQDLETTKAMLEEMSRQGVHTVVATPHFIASKDYPETFLEKRNASMKQLSRLEGDFPKIIPGAEVKYFFGMANSNVLNKLQLGNSGLLLIEMPFSPWSNRMVQEICQLKELTGLTPVLAHIDRYRQRKQIPRHMDTLLEKGVLFQCNTDAFFSFFSRRWALKLLKQGHIHFLGSDAHNVTTRPPHLGQAAQVISQKIGAEVLDNITAFTEKMLNL